MRPRFIVIRGRMRSIDAPIVQIRFANTAPKKRNNVFLTGPLGPLARKVNPARDKKKKDRPPP